MEKLQERRKSGKTMARIRIKAPTHGRKSFSPAEIL
jgi:hypothetical protein